MSINIHCPHCNQGYSVSENMVGRSIICKKCNNMITVEDIRDYDNVEVVEESNENQEYQQPRMQQPQQQYQNPHYQQGQYPPPPPHGYNQGQPQQPNQYAQYPPPPPHGYQPYAPMQQRVFIPNNMVWAILSLVLCFWPTGIAAVVYAAKVDPRIAMGDYEGAREAAAKSRKWSWISFFAGLIGMILYISMIATIGGAAAYSTYPY